MGPSGREKKAMGVEDTSMQGQLGIADLYKDLAGSFKDIAASQYGLSQEDRARMLQYVQPYTQQLTALTSGDRNAALAASMPVVQQVSAGFQGAKENIFNQLPAGPARDAALANLEAQKGTAIGGTQAQMVQAAPAQLATFGSGLFGPLSTTELGASLSGYQSAGSSYGGAGTAYSGAASTAGNVVQEEEQRKANSMSTFGGLAKLAGGIALAPFTGGASLASSVMGSPTQLWGAGKGQPFGSTMGAASPASTPAFVPPGAQVPAPWQFPSDRQLKTNVRPIREVLTPLRSIPVVNFDYVDGNKDHIGVIAQEVAAQFPELVRKNHQGYLTVDYAALAAVALAAVKELAEKVEALQIELDSMASGLQSSREVARAILQAHREVKTMQAAG